MLPLRGTKTMLAVSTDRLKKTSPAYSVGCDMWQDLIPQILPTLLQLVTYVPLAKTLWTDAKFIIFKSRTRLPQPWQLGRQ